VAETKGNDMKRILVTSAEGVKYQKAVRLSYEVKSELSQLGIIAHLASDVDIPHFTPDMVIAVGGDGTIMRSMKKYTPYGTPTFGVNGGTLGFLAGAEEDDWKEPIARVLSGDYTVEERLALAFTWRGQEFGPIANEVIVKQIDNLEFYQVSIDEHVMWQSIESRGFIVATPTGSNAENASNFGKLVFPTSTDVVLTPIQPHNPAAASFSIPQIGLGGAVSVKLLSGKYGDTAVQVWADGKRFKIDDSDLVSGESILVRKHPLALKLVTFGLPQHFRALKKKGYAL
jgi:NAD+ kinase